MLDQKEIARFAQTLAAAVVRDAHEFVAGEKVDVTQQEAEAILLTTLLTAAALEAHAITSLPPKEGANVRAFVERLSHDVQVTLNQKTNIITTPTDVPSQT